jgi:hypothetical protein
VGFPIRISTDQRLFAPSRSFSQRTTSFIASYRQGIHQMPLSHLIALISNAHPVLRPAPARKGRFGASTLGLDEHCRKTRIHQNTPSAIATSRRPQPLHMTCLAASDALRLRARSCIAAGPARPRHISSSRCQEIRVAVRARKRLFLQTWMHSCFGPKGQEAKRPGASAALAERLSA